MKNRILIVEDEKMISELICMNLEAVGYETEAVFDGEMAHQILRERGGEATDLALVDIMLPGKDGFELMELFKNCEIPVVFLTAKADVASKVRGLKLGAEDYIVKPFEILELIVPAAETIPVYKVEKHPYSKSDYEQFKRFIADEVGIQWGEEQIREDGRISLLSLDNTYHLSFSEGKGISTMLWLNNCSISDASSGSFNARDILGLKLSEEEKKQVEIRITEKANSFLDKLETGTYVLKECQWRALQERSSEFGDLKPNGEYGLRLRYVRAHNQVPVVGNLQALMGEGLPRSQYVEFLYTSDGTLLVIKDIDRIIQEENGDDERFLLPFAAVTQIFEQYGKTYYDDGRHPIEESESDSAVLAEENTLLAFVDVDTVMLEYRYQRQERQDQTEGGWLIPVWNFYGSLRIGNRASEKVESNPQNRKQESLLVSINAEDGTIYGN